MINQGKAIKSVLFILMCILLGPGADRMALAEVASPSRQKATISIGSRCSEAPSCVIVGGTHILEWKSTAPAKIIVVCIHGLGLCARAYKPLAQELSTAGIDGFGVNVREFGPDRDKPERAKLDCLDTIDDINKMLLSIRKDYPDYKVILVGESMGGALAVRIAAESPDLIDGLVVRHRPGNC